MSRILLTKLSIKSDNSISEWEMNLVPQELVSILLPVHKNNAFLSAALQSLLDQTYQSFEVLFLDNSERGLDKSIWTKSDRIRYIKVPANYGLSETLNVGIEKSQGSLLARMDYDDISYSHRLAVQVKFMNENPEVGICGSYAEVIGSNIDKKLQPGQIIYRPIEPEQMVEYLLYKNPLLHPTVMMRRSMIMQHQIFYRPRFDAAEDMDFWARSARHFKIANIPIPLLQYRIHDSQYSRVDGINSQLQSAKIRLHHSVWVFLRKRELRSKAIRVAVRSILKIFKLTIEVERLESFKKFT